MTLKVLHLRSSAGFYGAERVIVTLMKRLPDDGVDASLACIENYISGDKSLLEHAQSANLHAVEIPCKSRMDINTIKSLKAFCKDNQIDVIHSHDYKSHFYAAIVAKFAGCKQVATLHGKTFGGLKNRIYEFVENLLLRPVSHITVVSEQLYDALSKTNIKNRLSQIANGIDDHSFNPEVKGFGKEYWGFQSENFVFGVIARLSEEKGHQILLEAFAKISKQNDEARLLLVGDGPLYDELIDQAKKLGIFEKVNFTGSRTEVEQILNDMDCYVSPSHTEGMPMSILEAMAAALPIVATDVGAVGHLLRDDHGKLVEPGNVDELATQMQLILDKQNTIQALGLKCRKRIEEDYSASIQSEKFARIYRSVL